MKNKKVDFLIKTDDQRTDDQRTDDQRTDDQRTDAKTVLKIIENKNINYILDSTDVSEILGLSIRVVRSYLSKGKIKSKKVGKKYFVLYSDLVSFISA